MVKQLILERIKRPEYLVSSVAIFSLVSASDFCEISLMQIDIPSNIMPARLTLKSELPYL